MAVVVVLRELNGSQVRIPDAAAWGTDDDGQLTVWGPPQPEGPPRQSVLGTPVQPTSTPELALFASGTWLYARWEEDPADDVT